MSTEGQRREIDDCLMTMLSDNRPEWTPFPPPLRKTHVEWATPSKTFFNQLRARLSLSRYPTP